MLKMSEGFLAEYHFSNADVDRIFSLALMD